jgi:hypothetical protein
MIRLSAFADEISPNLHEQIDVLTSENIHFLDLRGVWNTNVLDLTDQQIDSIKKTLDSHNIRVAAIGSPIGKVSIDFHLTNTCNVSNVPSLWPNSFRHTTSASSPSILPLPRQTTRVQPTHPRGEMKCSGGCVI